MRGDRLNIRNWDKWQSYRRDRGQPPWIKVHREIMRNIEWVGMTDAQRGQLVAIWLLAADHDGVIPASPELVQKLCFMSEKPDLKFFMDQGFIEHDATLASERRQNDQPETETETETETEAEESRAQQAPPDVEKSTPEAKHRIPLTGNNHHPVTEDDLERYRELYPSIDVNQSIRNMIGWLEANPQRRSGTARGAKSRMTTWLARDQDKSSRNPSQGSGSVTKAAVEYRKQRQRILEGEVND